MRGTRVLTVASSRESSAWARWVASTSRSLPGTSCRFSYSRSTLPNWPMSFAAVFSPDAGHAGDVVDGVAHQREDIGDLLGLTPIFAFTAASSSTTRSPPRPRRRKHADPRAHELEHVLVGGDQDDVDGQIPHAVDEGAQHVVGLEARDLEQRHPQRLEQPPHVGGIWMRRSSGVDGRVSL